MRASAVVLAIALASGPAFADGGTLRLTQTAGPFVISVFSAPEPLRAGLADVSVLAQRRDRDTVLLDAAITVRMRAPDGATQTLVAAHAAATNRLLQSALVELASAGRWTLEVTVRDGRDAATVACALDVAPPAPRLAAQWPLVALPPLAIALFVWRQRLVRHRRRA